MNTILSFENALKWSWGRIIGQLIRELYFKYKFVRVERYLYSYEDANDKVRTVIAPLAEQLVEYFDLTLVQNIDSVSHIKGDKRKVVVRMGGMMTGNERKKTRYDKHLVKCGAVIACNEELFRISNKVNPRTYLIPNGVELELFRPLELTNYERSPMMLGFCGNIWGQGADYKGWKYFVQTCMIELPFDVQHKQLLHNQNDIVHEAMPEFFHSIDCFIMPSKNEGCSNTIAEALACGVPVLCTKVGYHGENLEDGENVLFIERDSKNIAEKIKMLMNDSKLREKLGINGRKFAVENHNIKRIAKKYDEVFKKVIKGD